MKKLFEDAAGVKKRLGKAVLLMPKMSGRCRGSLKTKTGFESRRDGDEERLYE